MLQAATCKLSQTAESAASLRTCAAMRDQASGSAIACAQCCDCALSSRLSSEVKEEPNGLQLGSYFTRGGACEDVRGVSRCD